MDYNKEIGQRIAKAAARVGGVSALAEKTSLRENQIYKYIQGKHTPAVSVVVEIAKATGVSVEWLAVGHEKVAAGRIVAREADFDWDTIARNAIKNALEYLKKSSDWLADKTEIRKADIDEFLSGTNLHPDDYACMAQVLVEARKLPPGIAYDLCLLSEERKYVLLPKLSGRALRDSSHEDSIAMREDWLLTLGDCIDVRLLAVVEMPDDSMEPTLMEGDMLIIDLRNLRTRHIAGPGLYLLVAENRVVVRRVRRSFSGNFYVTSDYPELYEQEEVTPDSFSKLTILGRVIWAGTRF